METVSNFFEWLNRLFGVQGPGELIFHPVFIGICVALFIYAIVKRMQFLTLAVGGLMGGALIVHYLYPENVSHLTDLIVFIGAMGGACSRAGLLRVRARIEGVRNRASPA